MLIPFLLQSLVTSLKIADIPSNVTNFISAKFTSENIDDKSSAAVGPLMNALYTLADGILQYHSTRPADDAALYLRPFYDRPFFTPIDDLNVRKGFSRKQIISEDGIITAVEDSVIVADLALHGYVDRGILTSEFNGIEVKILSLVASPNASKEERRSFYVGLLTKRMTGADAGAVSAQPLLRFGAGTGSIKVNETNVGSKDSCNAVGDVISIYVTKLDSSELLQRKGEVNVVICKNHRRIFSHQLKTCVVGDDGKLITYGLVPYVSVRKTGVTVQILNFIPARMSAAAMTAPMTKILTTDEQELFQLKADENGRVANRSDELRHYNGDKEL